MCAITMTIGCLFPYPYYGIGVSSADHFNRYI
mgnify:CR=1 FL=1